MAGTAFLSHTWQADEQGRDTHARVGRVAAALKGKGWKVWFDADEEAGMRGDLAQWMAKGIEEADVVVVFGTKKYRDKVNSGDNSDNCRKEYIHAARIKPNALFPVVMEAALKDPKSWTGAFGMHLGLQMYCDFSTGRDDVDDLHKQLLKKLGSSSPNADEASKDAEVLPIVNYWPYKVARQKALQYVEGTREWAVDEANFWASKGPWASNRVLAFVGPAGYGKSVLMARLCMEGGMFRMTRDEASADKTLRFSLSRLLRPLRRSSGTASSNNSGALVVGAAHFFKHDDGRAARVRTALYSVANQLALRLPDFRAELEKLDRAALESADLVTLFVTAVGEPASRIKSPGQRVAVILDALDEADEADQDALLTIITAKWHAETPAWLGLIVSTRPEDPIKNSMDAFEPKVLALDDERNMDDLRRYLSTRVQPYLRDPGELAKAVDVLADAAQGLFLYAYFVEEKLAADFEPGTLELRNVASVFPSGIDGMYREYFLRLLKGPLAGDLDLYARFLGAMVAARAPLPLTVLQACVGLDDDAFEDLLMRAEQLIDVGPDTVRFLHKSMSDFLQDRSRVGRSLKRVKAADGHRELAKVAWARSGDDTDDDFASRHTVFHLCRAGRFEDAEDWLLDFGNLHGALRLGVDPSDLALDVAAEGLVAKAGERRQHVKDVARLLEMSALAVRRDADELASQIMGRLRDPSHPLRKSVDAQWSPSVEWLRPVSEDCLESARSALRKVLLGHEDGATAVAISADGKTLASGSSDKTVRVWDAVTGTERRVLRGHTNFVACVAISSDGCTVVSGSDDNTTRVWDAVSGSQIRVLEGHTDWVRCVAITQDGKTAISGSQDQSIRLWDLTTGAEQRILQDGHHAVTCVAVSEDGQVLASGSSDTTVRVWDVAAGVVKHWLSGHTDWVRGVALSSDGKTVVSGSLDGKVRVWDAQAGGRARHVLSNHHGPVTSVALARDGETLASASYDKTVRLWDLASGEQTQLLRDHVRQVNGVAILPDGSMLASCSDDNTVRLWVADPDAESRGVQGHTDLIMALALAPDTKTVVSGSRDKSVRIWDTGTGEELRVLQGHSAWVTDVAFSSDGTTITSTDFHGHKISWDAHSGARLAQQQQPVSSSSSSSSGTARPFAAEGPHLCRPAATGFTFDSAAHNLVQAGAVVACTVGPRVHVLRRCPP
ncbi:Uncharacterized WD repeat-containing protein alr3466 [Durusdinium trenchii]|uniref:Uncharacterized WD repeat-containing protein alr3466 n=1 Tax=Durusdinium trenchii TaxID=1381693 RepID=A0ABP0JXP6_9DINO